MSNLVRSTDFGGIYAKSLHGENYANRETKYFREYQKFTARIEKYKKIYF